jgi:hypothetical protein
VSSHAVHTKTDDSEILLAPVECLVEMTLCLAGAVDSAAHVAQEITSRKAHKSDAILDLMPYTNCLVL